MRFNIKEKARFRFLSEHSHRSPERNACGVGDDTENKQCVRHRSDILVLDQPVLCHCICRLDKNIVVICSPKLDDHVGTEHNDHRVVAKRHNKCLEYGDEDRERTDLGHDDVAGQKNKNCENRDKEPLVADYRCENRTEST